MENTLSHQRKFKLSNNLREALVFGICLVCMFLLVYTAYSKIIDHQRFVKGLSRVEVIGPYALIISWLVPSIEILISLLLLLPRITQFRLYCFLGMMIVFTGYILSMLFWAKKLPCHCGGVIEQLSWVQHVWFNLAFIGLAVIGLWLGNLKNKH